MVSYSRVTLSLSDGGSGLLKRKLHTCHVNILSMSCASVGPFWMRPQEYTVAYPDPMITKRLSFFAVSGSI
jgi:hypothetical protein